MKLVIAPCSHDAAKFAVENWHYSRILPTGKLVRYGVWEDDQFIGAVIYSRGASPHLGTFIGLDATEVCELTRVAMRDHATPVSQVLAVTLKLLKQSNPGIRCVVSFADPKEGHVGGIYKATNWLYTGQSPEKTEYLIEGRWRHARGAWHHPERKSAPTRVTPGKFRYLFPLDKGIRRALMNLALPYPTKPSPDTADGSRGGSVDGDAPDFLSGEAGSTPALRSNKTKVTN